MKVLTIDTETTGLSEPDAVSIAYIPIYSSLSAMREPAYLNLLINDNWKHYFYDIYEARFCPDKPIEAGASKVNGIYYKDVMYESKSSSFALPKEICFLIGHNIAFDWRVLNYHGLKQAKIDNLKYIYPPMRLICTKELAQLVFSDENAPKNNKLQSLIEFLYPEEANNLLSNSHTALQDTRLCLLVFLKILDRLPMVENWEDLAKLCSQGKKTYEQMNKTIQPLEIIPFGKYKNKRLTELPVDYLGWLVKQANITPALEAGIRKALKEINS